MAVLIPDIRDKEPRFFLIPDIRDNGAWGVKQRKSRCLSLFSDSTFSKMSPESITRNQYFSLKQRYLRCFAGFSDNPIFCHKSGDPVFSHNPDAAIGQNELVILDSFAGKFRNGVRLEVPLRLQLLDVIVSTRA